MDDSRSGSAAVAAVVVLEASAGEVSDTDSVGAVSTGAHADTRRSSRTAEQGRARRTAPSVSGRLGRDTGGFGVRRVGGPLGVDRPEDGTRLTDTLEPLGTGGPVEPPRRGGVDEEELVGHGSHHAEGV